MLRNNVGMADEVHGARYALDFFEHPVRENWSAEMVREMARVFARKYNNEHFVRGFLEIAYTISQGRASRRELYP